MSVMITPTKFAYSEKKPDTVATPDTGAPDTGTTEKEKVVVTKKKK